MRQPCSALEYTLDAQQTRTKSQYHSVSPTPVQHTSPSKTWESGQQMQHDLNFDSVSLSSSMPITRARENFLAPSSSRHQRSMWQTKPKTSHSTAKLSKRMPINPEAPSNMLKTNSSQFSHEEEEEEEEEEEAKASLYSSTHTLPLPYPKTPRPRFTLL